MEFNIEEIKRKNKNLDEAVIKLKNDFIGIDEQIDQVINNIRSWYLYPELQSRPLVISLFGMTGTGKTDLVRKLVKYLDIEKDLVYFNFAEIGEMRSYEIESNIEDELGAEKSNRVFVYDEFQYAATLDSTGGEKDNKSGLKPFWELMDSGILHRRHVLWEISHVYNLLNYLLKINNTCSIILEDGKWINSNECLSHFKPYEVETFANYFNFVKPDFNRKSVYPINNPHVGYGLEEESSKSSKCNDDYDYFIQRTRLEKVIDLYTKTYGGKQDKFELYKTFCEKNVNEFIEILVNLCDNLSKGYDMDFSNSIIFVLANIDEAYTISFNVDPDMTPDRFYKISKKITIVDIKEALQKRFRNEQIARLGNIHVIYPAFSSDTFKKLIEKNLNEYSNKVYELTGYEVRFANSIKKLIYDEAVFPTHGARPIFSTIHEIVKSKLPNIIRHIQENDITDIGFLEYTFKNKKTIIDIFDVDNKKVGDIIFNEKLQLNKLRESRKDEHQALCAVHESGHFVVYTALKNKLPEKVISRAAESSTGGFMAEDIDNIKLTLTLNDVITELQILLGGYIAEKLVFGKDYLTNGACSDLEKATMLASKAIRDWGFSKHPYVKTYLLNLPLERTAISGYLIKDDGSEVQNAIISLFNEAYEKTENLLKKPEWKSMLKESAKYLSVFTNIPYKKMKEMYNKVPADKKACQNDRYYRDAIENM